MQSFGVVLGVGQPWLTQLSRHVLWAAGALGL